MDQNQKAELFRQLHFNEELLVLPNCWDAISAKVLQKCRFSAIATASASISWAWGVPDGERLSRKKMIETIGVICDAVDIPVSADIEQGYGDTPQEVKNTVRAVVSAGAVGINIEDSTSQGIQREVEDMQQRIAGARSGADEGKVNLVINARIDGYLLGGKSRAVFDDTVVRAKAWAEAGADCIFIPGIDDLSLIQKLTSKIESPVNVLIMNEKMPNVSALKSAGAARVSSGPRLMQKVMGELEKAAGSIVENGNFEFLSGAPGFADLNKL
jgi:2-methylisocitrate lyase-like PEP mutase family enzyme